MKEETEQKKSIAGAKWTFVHLLDEVPKELVAVMLIHT
jgi:hypothetical protein